MLDGLPADLLGATIAHELGHVFLHLNDFEQGMPPPLVEGLCELISYLWLEQALDDRDDVAEVERHARMRVMAQSRDEVYGQGFRDALAAYEACGASLPGLLQEVKASGGLPMWAPIS